MTQPGKIAVILKGYPRLSETFIADELLALENGGLDLTLVSLRHPTDTKQHPVHGKIIAPVSYLPEYLHHQPRRVVRCWRTVRRWQGYRAARSAFTKDLLRDFSRNRIRRWGQAMVCAAELPEDVTHLHAHFIHTPGSVARYAGLISGLAWSCSAHAKDIWTSPDWELKEKLASAEWTVTCSKDGKSRLEGLAPSPGAVALVYHGIDLCQFSDPGHDRPSRDGTDITDPVRLLSVGRAVPKKGLDILIRALGKLPAELHWNWTHIGGGPDLQLLKTLSAQLSLSDRVEFCGALTRSEVLSAYRRADLFVLPCRIANDGDRDGLPNVIVEAQSQKLACVSTNVAGIPELLEDGVNGRIVEPDQSEGLAVALAELIRSPRCRARMGQAGRKRVAANLDQNVQIRQLLKLFGVVPEPRSLPLSA